MTHRVRLALTVAGVTLLLSSIRSSAQGNVTPPNSSAPPRVHLLRPNQTAFSSVLDSKFSKIAADKDYTKFRDATVLVVNDTKMNVQAVVLKWTIPGSDGSPQVIYRAVFPEPHYPAEVPGMTTALAPSHVALVSPFSDVEDTGSMSRQRQFETRALVNPEIQTTGGSAQISVAIDSVIFQKGTIVGADEYGMLTRFTCERNAAIDEAQSLRSLADNRASLQERLSNDAISASNGQDDSSCTSSKGREAVRLQALLDRGGVSDFSNGINRIAAAHKVTLARWKGTPQQSGTMGGNK